jgi:hypothetical protein
VNVHPDVALRSPQRLTRVDPHANPNQSSRKLSLSIRGRGDRVARASERDEERVTLRVDLDAPVLDESLPKNDSVSVESIGVISAELVKELGRALDVGEEEGDGAGRQLYHHVVSSRVVFAKAIASSRPSSLPASQAFVKSGSPMISFAARVVRSRSSRATG